MTPYDTSRSLIRRVPIHDSPSVEEYHGPVNSTKLLISRSVYIRGLGELGGGVNDVTIYLREVIMTLT